MNRETENIPRRVRWIDRLKFTLYVQRYSVPFWHNMLLRIVLGPIVSMLMLLPAFISRYAVDVVFATSNVEGWIACTVGIAAIWLLSFVCTITSQLMTFEMATRLELCLRDRLFSHGMKLSLRFHEKRPVGEQVFRLSAGDMSRLTEMFPTLGQDAIDAVGLCAVVPVLLVRYIIEIVMVISVMTIVSAQIGMMIIAYVPVYMVVTHWMMSHVQRANRESRDARQGVEARARESLTIFKLTKAFGRQIFENKRFHGASANAMRKNLRNDIWNVFYSNIAIGHATPLFLLVLDYIAGMYIFAGKMTPGDFTLFPPLVMQLLIPITSIFRTIQDARLRFVAVDRVMETLQAKPEIVDAVDAAPIPAIRGDIEFRDVTFGYDPSKPVLHNVSFRILPAQKVAFVGPSGAGKTSIVNLLMRFYDPVSGTVLIDGHDLRTVRLRDFRGQTGMVLQDSLLFSGSILSNIKYGKPSATIDEVEHAAHIADIDGVIATLPERYETPVSEAGNLSAGQKQRISIARAVIREPRILILDEATSAVDPIVEREVIAAINEFAKDHIVVLIAHNLVSVQDADKIFVVSNGRLLQEGTHEELMARDGLYRTMWTKEAERQT